MEVNNINIQVICYNFSYSKKIDKVEAAMGHEFMEVF